MADILDSKQHYENLTKEQQELIQANVKKALAHISQERIDKVIDMIEKISAFSKNHPNATKPFIQLLSDRGNFTSIPTEEEIRKNPEIYVSKLENDLMVIFDILQRGETL